MPVTFTEDDLKFHFTTALHHEKFDTRTTHFLSHCMKAVDFIVELPKRILFLEIKDPQHPSARSVERDKFVEDLLHGTLIKETLRPKCCDTLLYKLATEDIDVHKPLYYYVLIALDTLKEPELMALRDKLKSRLPIVQRGSRVERKFTTAGKPAHFIQACGIFNIATWNRVIGRELQASVSRISDEVPL
ncbi:MAG: hypothetical protein ACP5HG_12515 [Anaerolineae bacterium]